MAYANNCNTGYRVTRRVTRNILKTFCESLAFWKLCRMERDLRREVISMNYLEIIKILKEKNDRKEGTEQVKM